MDEWLPVKYRMPANGATVWVYCNQPTPYVTLARHDAAGWYSVIPEMPVVNVTHWQRLVYPKPPVAP